VLSLPRSFAPLARTAPGRELLASLAVLAAVFAFALALLAVDGNWPKLARVGVAASVYVGAVAGLARRHRPPPAARAYPYRVFALAGAGAGACGSALRPGGAPPLAVLVGVLGGAGLFAAVHWLALRALRRTRDALEESAPRGPAG
jgi:hypothetical protein